MDMLNIETIATLEPVSSFAPAQIYELLDHCHLQLVPAGQDLIKLAGLEGQVLYLLAGEIELIYRDDNRLTIRAGSEWAKQPLGKHQPPIAAATARGDIKVLSVNNDLLNLLIERNRKMPQENAQAAAGGHPLSGGNLLNSGMNSIEHFKMWPFHELPPGSLGRLLRLIEVTVAWENDAVVREGEQGDYYYLVEKGQAEVSRRVGGVDMVLAELKPGDAFGEEALISGAKRNATVIMKSNGVLLRLKQSDFLELMQGPLLRHLSYPEAVAKAATGAAWLDVRHPPEYRHGKLEGAISLPLNDVRSAVGVLGKNRPYITYCNNGRRSAVAAFILARAGYDVCVLDGGLQAADGCEGNRPAAAAAA